MSQACHAALGSAQLRGSAVVGASVEISWSVTSSPGSYRSTSAISASGTIRVNGPQGAATQHDEHDAEYREQKKAFMKRASEEPLFLAAYSGRFIASKDGQIVESDRELSTVTDRFFSRYGDVPVYIGRVDGKRKVFVDSPNRVR